MATITAQRTENITLNVTDVELGHAVMQVAWERCGKIDDAGCDWLTEGCCVYIGSREWLVKVGTLTARLVDAANILKYGQLLRLSDQEEAE